MDANQKRQAVVSQRLEPLGWRTTQHEAPNYEQRATAGKWGCLLTAIINYQNKHRGMSPTDPMLAKETGLTIDQVRYHLREMEKAGLVVDVKGWPRHISVVNAAKVQAITQLDVPAPKKVEEAKVVHSDEVQRSLSNAVGSRKKPFIVRAKEIAQAIIDHYDQHGIAPTGTWLTQRVYGTRGGNLAYVVNRMVELGWVYHKPRCQHDYAVTGLGRAALFGQVGEQLHTDTPINPMDRPLAPSEPRREPIAQPATPTPQPTIPRPVPLQKAPVAYEEERFIAKPDPEAVAMFEDVDLVMELIKRGFKVSR